MLTRFYQDIALHLSEGLKALGIAPTQFGLEKTNQTIPFFEVSGDAFRVKAPAFQKTSGEVRWVQPTERFTLPENEAEKKGPYDLQIIPEKIIGVSIATHSESSESAVVQLANEEYALIGQEVTLSATHPAGSTLAVTYRHAGIEHTDRFTQGFALSIYEPDKEKAETYALLSLTAIWAAWGMLMEKTYEQVTGNLSASVTLTDLRFLGEEGSNEAPGTEAPASKLMFEAAGRITLREARPDGAHTIQQVDLGEENVTLAPNGGIEIRRTN
ncbi:MAG: hypothetical protein AAGA66_02305 [Bacteroidota bacterium]